MANISGNINITITSTYRNPYRNWTVTDASANSRHMWAGAVDMDANNRRGLHDAIWQTNYLKILEVKKYDENEPHDPVSYKQYKVNNIYNAGVFVWYKDESGEWIREELPSNPQPTEDQLNNILQRFFHAFHVADKSGTVENQGMAE